MVTEPKEERNGWLGRGRVKWRVRKIEMKQTGVFLVNMCHAQLLTWCLLVMLQALGLNSVLSLHPHRIFNCDPVWIVVSRVKP